MRLTISGTTATLAGRVKEARVSAGLSQTELAARIKRTKSAISQIESGLTRSLSLETALGIQAATGYSAIWLRSGAAPQQVDTNDGVPADCVVIKRDTLEALLTLARMNLSSVKTVDDLLAKGELSWEDER